MSNPKSQKPSTPDSLTKAGKNAGVELAESQLDKIAGGQDVTVNKAKTADKAYTQMDGYIKQ
jgi:hypothetical protein